MPPRITIILAAVLLIAGGNPRDRAPRTNREQFQGTWELITLEVNAQQAFQIALGDLAEARLVAEGDSCRLRFGEAERTMTYRLNPGKAPQAIDLTVTAGPDKSKTFRGIYALDGDTLKICYHPQPGKARPSAFTGGADAGFLVFTWRRLKP
jgi:uncharacterized protein (TIGR03067 family)